MSETTQSFEHADASSAGPKLAYEKADLQVGAVIKFGIGLAVAIAVIQLIIVGVYWWIAGHQKAAQPKLSPLVQQAHKQLPQNLEQIPEPRLQAADTVDYAEWQKGQTNKLESYGWVNEKKGVARIPIEQAMKILADPEQQSKYGIHTAAKK